MSTMTAVRQTLYASFADTALAEKAAGALLDNGARAEDISLISKDTRDTWRGEKDEHGDLAAKTGISTTTPADAAAGAAKGAGIGLGVGVLAALGALFIPGVGLVAGSGALATAIAGAAGATAAGAVAGGVHGYLKDQGMPEEAMSRFAEDYRAGGTILAVNLPSGTVDERRGEEMLRKYDGRYICAFEG